MLTEKIMTTPQKEQGNHAEQSTDVVINLLKPLEYNGHSYTEVTLDLEGLTGEDSMAVENEMMQRKKGTVIVGALNNDYIIGIAARACKEPLGSDAFLQMKLKDYNRIKEAVRNFLLK